MMKIKARFAAFAAAMLAAVLCLAACNGGVGGGDDSTVATTAEPPLTFTRGDAAGYVIVIGSNATSGEREAALTLSDAFRLRLGIDLEVTADDGETTETEMIVGNTSRGVPAAWGTDAHRTGDWFAGAEGKKVWFIGGSDAATENAVNGFIEKILLKADDGITLGEPLVHYASSRLGSITLNGDKEMKNIKFGLPDTKSFTREVAGILADAVTGCYGYEATIAGDGEAADILLTTAELSPEYAGVLGDRAAVLTSVAGKAALVGRDQASLVFAMNRLTAELDSLTALEIKDGEIAFEYSADDTVCAMSFNVLGGADITQRQPAVLWVIADEMPDFFGIQEGKEKWILYLNSKLGGVYATVGKGNAESGYTETYNNIYYRTDRFTLVEGDTVWLSETSGVPDTKFSMSKRVRTATYALLREKSTGREVLAVSVHLDNASNEARLKQADVLIDLIKRYNCTVAVVGDFNSSETSEVHSKMAAVLADSRTDAAARDTAPTYNNLGSGKGSVLDYIFITKGTEITEYRVHTGLYKGKVYPSDHNAIAAVFRLG